MRIGVLGFVVGGVEEVACFEAVRLPEDSHVAREQEGACDGHAEHFVGVCGDAARSLDARELVAVCVGKDGATAPRGIDVHPKVVFFTQICNFMQGVKGAEDGGSQSGIDEKGFEALQTGFS